MSLSMGDAREVFTYQEEGQGDRLARKAKETPVFPIAIGVVAAGCVYGAYMYKRRGQMSTSVYLMHLRVGAQGAAVASLTAGLLYTMINDRILKRKPAAEN